MLRSITVDGQDLYAYNCDGQEARRLSKSKELLCPNCSSFVRYKSGDKVSAHFAHIPGTECIDRDYEKETAEHIKGKQIIYTWLKNKLPKDIVELEVYIPETQQIADVLVTFQEDWKGRRWAFEFQHSPLSDKHWRQRHRQYQEAGICVIWLLDSSVFLKYSKSDEDARLFREPVEAIYKDSGLCYFLDIETSKLTIDCNFESYDKKVYLHHRGTTVVNSYTYHDPIEHSTVLDDIEFWGYSDYPLGCLNYSELSDQIKGKLEQQYNQYDWERRQERQELIRMKIWEIKDYCEHIATRHFGDCMRAFAIRNMAILTEDILQLSAVDFMEKFERYGKILSKIIYEYRGLASSKETIAKVIARKAPYYYVPTEFYDFDEIQTDRIEMEIFKLDFLDQFSGSFVDLLVKRYELQIENVRYVLQAYDDQLGKLLKYNRKAVERRLLKINHYNFPRSRNDLTKLDFACGFMDCRSRDEVDQLMDIVKKDVIEDIEAPPV